MRVTRLYELDGFRDVYCPHRVGVELLLKDEPRGNHGDTIWTHGENREAVMVVTPAMRKKWDAERKRSVEEMGRWIERVHEYEAFS